MDDGFNVAMQFFALGLLWLFIGGVLLTAINWLRQLVG